MSPPQDYRPHCRRSAMGFSLIELIVVVAIIGLLIAIIIPTISKARESSLRIVCASNLRQCGLVESIYSNENHGWLLMRGSSNSGTISSLVPPSAHFFSIDFSKYSSPQIWFCPEYNGVGLSSTGLWSANDKSVYVGQLNRFGYGFFGAYWDGTRAWYTQPAFGSISQYTNNIASKATHLRPYMVRMTEWYSDNFADWGTTGGSKWHTSLRRKQGPEGGNLLFADGSVTWSRNIFCFFGGERYTIPEGYSNVP